MYSYDHNQHQSNRKSDVKFKNFHFIHSETKTLARYFRIIRETLLILFILKLFHFLSFILWHLDFWFVLNPVNLYFYSVFVVHFQQLWPFFVATHHILTLFGWIVRLPKGYSWIPLLCEKNKCHNVIITKYIFNLIQWLENMGFGFCWKEFFKLIFDRDDQVKWNVNACVWIQLGLCWVMNFTEYLFQTLQKDFCNFWNQVSTFHCLFVTIPMHVCVDLRNSTDDDSVVEFTKSLIGW